MDTLAELVCLGFLGFYLIFLLSLLMAPLVRRRRSGPGTLQPRRFQNLESSAQLRTWPPRLSIALEADSTEAPPAVSCAAPDGCSDSPGKNWMDRTCA